MPRSTCVHPDHQPTVVLALERNGYLTQGDLAANLEIALSTVSRFFRGIRISIANFEHICEALALEPKEIMQPLGGSSTTDSPQPSKATVQNTQFFAYDAFWVGRDQLVEDLSTKLLQDARLLLLVGLSGIGKTALAERLLLSLQNDTKESNDVDQAALFHLVLQENFDNPEQASDFTSVASRLLESCGQKVSPEERTQPTQLMRRLVAYLQAYPVLILIDSLEQLLQSGSREDFAKAPTEIRSEFTDSHYLAFFKALLASNQCQSRLILTSQELPSDLIEVGNRYINTFHCQPLSGLAEAEQKELFEKTGFTSSTELVRIGKAYEGHPLALRTILGEISARPFFGNVAAYWKRYGQEIEAVESALAEAAAGNTTGIDDKWQLERFTRALRRSVQARLERTFERLRQDARMAYILLCETSVYRCAVPEDWWLSHLEDWQQGEAEQLVALDVLRDRYLVEESTEDTELLLKQHNLIRSLSLSHLKQLTYDV